MRKIIYIFVGILPISQKGISLETFVWCIYAILLIIISESDLKTNTIPDKLQIGIICCTIAMIFLQPQISIYDRIVGGLVISVPMLVIANIKLGTFGGGDIKLMATSGLLIGTMNILVSMMIGMLIAGARIIYLLLRRRIDRHTQMPIGPYLCVGCYIAMLYGDIILKWYLDK